MTDERLKEAGAARQLVRSLEQQVQTLERAGLEETDPFYYDAIGMQGNSPEAKARARDILLCDLRGKLQEARSAFEAL